jgi:hypothetical protein
MVNDFDLGYKSTARHGETFFTNASVEIGGTLHQICVRGASAAAMTANYFTAVDALTAAYAARARWPDPAKLLTLVQCGIAKAVKRNDFDRVNRLMKAVEIVQAGGVIQEGGCFVVTSQHDPTCGYRVNSEGACSCEDYKQHVDYAQKWYCKHSLSCIIYSRVIAMD